MTSTHQHRQAAHECRHKRHTLPTWLSHPPRSIFMTSVTRHSWEGPPPAGRLVLGDHNNLKAVARTNMQHNQQRQWSTVLTVPAEYQLKPRMASGSKDSGPAGTPV